MKPRRIKDFVAVFSLLFLGSCFPTSDYFNAHLASYKGEPSTYLLRRLGPPTTTLKLPHKQTVWAYFSDSTTYISNNQMSTVMMPLTSSCHFWFVLDSEDTVNKVGHKGDNCQTSRDGTSTAGLKFWGGTVLPPAR
ncbi:MAG: hypothetical protein ACYCVG_09295 [Leptospirillum sp.]|jgi:hypothetical protein